MLATFCIRLACGMAGALLVLSPAQINPRFYKAQFLTVLGLTALATFVLGDLGGLGLRLILGLAMLSAFVGSVVWSLDKAPGGKTLVVLTAGCMMVAIGGSALASPGESRADEMGVQSGPVWQVAGELTSAALLGAATTAMLMGHSYLIAPSMSLTPLLRLLGLLFVATVLRMLVAGVGLWSWSAVHAFTPEDETVLWLPLRWGLGFIGPLILGWMAWQTTKIRSTQSATGILYVVVIFCFLGELTSQLLQRNTGYLM